MKNFLKALAVVFGGLGSVLLFGYLGQTGADYIGLRPSTLQFISGFGWGACFGIFVWEIKNQN